MTRSSREGTLPDSLADCKLKGSQRKPPRHVAAAAGHGVNAMGASKDHPDQSNGGAAGGKLTTFQKLDREMGKFVASQPNFQKVAQVRDSCGNLLQQGSEEDSTSRGIRHGVKMWKCGWMFEQDSLYWDTVRRQNVSGDDQESSWSRPPLKTVKEKDGDNMAGGTMSSTSSEDHPPPQPLLCSTDYEAATYSGMELHLRKNSSSLSKSKSRLRDSSSTCGSKGTTIISQNGGKSIPRSSEKEGSWPAVLKAKCELLQVEKDLANQRWRQQCAEMAQAAEMAHCLRASVQTILETAKRGTVSAPCTPARLTEADHLSLLHRVQHQLPVFGASGQRDHLEDQAETFQKRIEKLRQKSQVRSSADLAASLGQDNDAVETKSRPSSTSNSAQSIMTKAEEWAQVHEVLRRLSNQTASLKESCQSWEKRAMSAESKAATLQVEEERWRVEVQKSEEKIKELEKELTVVRATMEEVKNRHALEQSRLVGSCGSHGYTLVLKPFLQTATTDHSGLGTNQCRCSVSDFGSCVICGGISTCAPADHQRVNQAATNSNSCPASYLSRETKGGDDTSDQTCTADGEPANRTNPAAKSSSSSTSFQGLMTTSSSRATSSTSPSPRRTASQNSGGTIRHRYEWSNSIRDVSPRVPIKASPDKKTTSARGDEPGGRSSELERSLSQRWIKQRPKTTRPAPDQAILLDAPGTNSGGSPRLSTKLQSDIGSKVVSKGPSPLRKPSQLSTGSSCRVPSPSPVDKPRAPLKEMKRNTSVTKS